MRSRVFTGAFMLVAILAAGAAATSGDLGSPARQWALVYLVEPTLIGASIVHGPVLFTHDDAKMARGEACTTVYLVEPASGPQEEVAAFHCTPTSRGVVAKFTIRTRPNDDLGFGCVLTEYQFAGDAEGHRVPTAANAH